VTGKRWTKPYSAFFGLTIVRVFLALTTMSANAQSSEYCRSQVKGALSATKALLDLPTLNMRAFQGLVSGYLNNVAIRCNEFDLKQIRDDSFVFSHGYTGNQNQVFIFKATYKHGCGLTFSIDLPTSDPKYVVAICPATIP
jgi:hypothetical protein